MTRSASINLANGGRHLQAIALGFSADIAVKVIVCAFTANAIGLPDIF